MNLQPILLDHQSFFNRLFQSLNLPFSEFSFANIYLFRKIHQYQLLKIDNYYFVKGLTRDKFPFIMLIDHPSNYKLDSIRSALSQGKFLYPIPENWLSFFSNENIEMSFNENESDYLYPRSQFASYPGRHLSKKRNLVKQLLTQHRQIQAYPLTSQKIDAKIILNKWLEENNHKKFDTDYEECLEALKLCDSLHLEGRIFYVDDQPEGFALGEKISDDCFAIHFCKAAKEIKGLYQFIFQNFAQSLPENYLWLNLEQDLGIAEIRDAKLSYQPVKTLLKFRLTIH